jgi:uncharacterized protein YggU (UPF0235/DUF167 family)
VLSVHLTPRASRDEVLGLGEGPEGPVLKARVRGVPEKGRANQALLALVAKWLGVAKSSVTLAGGGKSRRKKVHVAGPPDQLIDTVNSRIAELS